ncbi:glycosyltransferase family 4 protein [Spirochaetia bacterium 38H-sp]|uniref:Glycosyltransferase family 4 protein n=1 Tax=Rarispira pelagica TaxID=3141764 RepID=A0ABU9U9X0_9SPIR
MMRLFLNPNRRLKILMISYEFPPVVSGGIGKLTYDKYQAYKESGHDIVLIAPVSHNRKKGQLYIPAKGNILKFFLTFFYSFFSVMIRKPDIIYALSGTYVGFVSFIISKIFSIPYVVLAHGNEFIRFYNKSDIRKVLNIIYNNSLIVLAVSSFTKKLLIDFGVDKNKIEVVNNYIDSDNWIVPAANQIVEVREKYDLKPQDFVLITVSRLDKRKGHDKIIKALALMILNFPEFRGRIKYIIVGNGKEYDRLKNMVCECNLNDSVLFFGYVPYRDLSLLYAISDLFVMPSSFLRNDGSVEGFGLSYIEAAIYGLPSVAGIESGAIDIIDDDKTGFLVNPDDIYKIQEVLLYCVKNKERVKDMGVAARNSVLSRFSKDKLYPRELSLILRWLDNM